MHSPNFKAIQFLEQAILIGPLKIYCLIQIHEQLRLDLFPRIGENKKYVLVWDD